MLREAVQIIVRVYAETGIDFISVGAITHSSDWLDMSVGIGTL